MNRKFLFLICLILFLFTVSSVSATDLNQTVTENVLSVGEGTFSDLQEDINNAGNGSTINLDNDYVYDGDDGEGINITKDITINGNGYTLDGNYASRIFNIQNANVVLNNIVFVNAMSDEGGAIRIFCLDDSFKNYNNLEINNCSFIGNDADCGGAVYAYFNNLKINDCSFVSNSATQNGGAIDLLDSNALINNSIFLNNFADNGAVIRHDAFFYINDIVISNTILNDNVANVDLGIVHIYGVEYVYGDVYLRSNDPLADHQIDITPPDEWFPYPNLTFINVSYNEFENQSFIFDVDDLNFNMDNETIRFEVYGDDVLLINTTNITYGGIAKIDYSNLSVTNNYTLKVYYGNLTDSALLRVKKDSNFTMSVDDIVLGDDLVINFSISPEIEDYDDATATVEIYDTGVYRDLPIYFAYFNLKDGNITIPFAYLGNFDVVLYFDGDETFYPKLINQTFNVYNVDYNLTGNRTTLNSDAVYKYVGGNERLYVILTDGDNNPLANKKISMEINGVTYTRTTDELGSTSIAINLPEGYYRVILGFGGDDVYLPIKNVSEIMVYSTIYCQDMSKYVGGPEKYMVECIDGEGNKLIGGEVEFNINGVIYYRQIDENGISGLNINLAQGTYIITAKNPVTGEMQSREITVLPSIVNNHDLVKYYRNDSQFTVDLDGPFASKDQTVTFNINGVMYERKTNENGTAQLNINLAPGEYIITSMFNGCMVSNKIIVLPILEATDLNMFYLDGSTFNATLLDGQGEPLANKNVTFNINGVFYNRPTDDNGIARLNIRLMRGEYIITSSYNECNIANKITIV